MPFNFTNPSHRYFQHGDIFLGRCPDTEIDVGIRTERHLLTIAGSGAGKGVALIIPNLLTWQGSVVVIDPSGGNVSETWQAREDMGQRVVVLDPFRVAKVPERLRSSCNLLASIKPESLSCRADIRAIADGLVMRYKSEDGTWDNGAVSVLAGMIAYVLAVQPPDACNLHAVRQLLTLPQNTRDEVFEEMSSLTGFGNLAKGAAAIGLSTTKKNQEFVGGAVDHSEWLDDEAMKTILTGDGFRLSDLKTKPCSVFLVLPIRYLSDYGRFLRLFVRCALNVMEEGGTNGQRCLFILDEFFSLGHIDQIAKAVGALRKNGVQLWPIMQDLGQLTTLYGRDGAHTFFSNSDAHIFFGNSDAPSLDYISARIGPMTPDEAAPYVPQRSYVDPSRPSQGQVGPTMNERMAAMEAVRMENEGRIYQHQMASAGRPRLTADMVKERVAKRHGDIVARSMIVFGQGNEVLNLQLAPYFLPNPNTHARQLERQKEIQSNLHETEARLKYVRKMVIEASWMLPLFSAVVAVPACFVLAWFYPRIPGWRLPQFFEADAIFYWQWCAAVLTGLLYLKSGMRWYGVGKHLLHLRKACWHMLSKIDLNRATVPEWKPPVERQKSPVFYRDKSVA